jgi:diaphanous 2
MNNSVGIKEVFQQKEAITIIAKSLDPSKPQVMLEALKVMAALCLVPPDGLDKVLEGITLSGEFKGEERFLPLVKALSSSNSSDSLKVINKQLLHIYSAWYNFIKV